MGSWGVFMVEKIDHLCFGGMIVQPGKFVEYLLRDLLEAEKTFEISEDEFGCHSLS